MLHGAGYAFPTFYGDIQLYLLATPLSLIDAQDKVYEQAYKIYLACTYISQFIAWYIQTGLIMKLTCIKEKIDKLSINRKELSLLAQILQVSTPYAIQNLLQQSVRIAATQAIPVAIYNFLAIYLKRKGNDKNSKTSILANIIGLQMQMWFIVNQHNITFILQILMLFIMYMAIQIHELYRNKRVTREMLVLTLNYMISAQICAVQSLYLIVPMVEQLRTKIYVVSNQVYDLQSVQSQDIRGLFFGDILLRVIYSIFGVQQKNDAAYSGTGYTILYIALLVVISVAVFIRKRRKVEKTVAIINIAYTLCYIGVMYTSFNPKFLQFMQFKSRLNTVFDVVFIALVVINIAVFNEYREKIVKYLLKVVSITCVIQVLLSIFIQQTGYDLSIQIGGGAEYLVYNKAYSLENSTAIITYGTEKQVTDIVNYIEYFNSLDGIQIETPESQAFEKIIHIDNLESVGNKLQEACQEIGYHRNIDTKQARDKETFTLWLPITYYNQYYNIKIDGNTVEYSPSPIGLIQVEIPKSSVNNQTTIDIEYNIQNTYKALGIIQIAQVVSQIYVLIKLRRHRVEE